MRRFAALRMAWGLVILILVVAGHRVLVGSESADSLEVRVELVDPGSKFVGQPFELRVSVNAADERPRLELPTALGAELAIVNTGLQPLAVSQIGSFTAQENRFLTRIRVIPSRVGTLVIPPVRASLGRRSGRSQPVKVAIVAVPSTGRPAEFLGGVGAFSVGSGVSASAMRMGQEFEFRVDVSGPAAAGMTEAPSLEPLRRLAIAPSVQFVSNLATIEPLARTFRYRLRPTRAGEVVLPPVRIAAFDPASQRYLTRVTNGVPIRVLAVPAFDPASVGDVSAVSESARSRPLRILGAAGGAAIVLAIASILLMNRYRSRRLRDGEGQPGRELALRIVGELATAGDVSRSPGIDDGALMNHSLAVQEWSIRVAREVTDGLIQYLEVTTKRPPGALTPDEALAGIETGTGSTELGVLARDVVTVCDGVRFRLDSPLLEEHTQAVIEQGRSLFGLLAEQRFAGVRQERVRLDSQTRSGMINDGPARVSETPRY